MNSADWMDLIREAGPELRKRGWRWKAEGPGGRKHLRDAQGFCPLCALAATHGCLEYRGAWSWALKRAFDLQTHEVENAALIALAADNGHYYKMQARIEQIRAELNAILEPCNG